MPGALKVFQLKIDNRVVGNPGACTLSRVLLRTSLSKNVVLRVGNVIAEKGQGNDRNCRYVAQAETRELGKQRQGVGVQGRRSV